MVEIDSDITRSLSIKHSIANDKLHQKADDDTNSETSKHTITGETIKEEYIPKDDVYISLEKNNLESGGVVNEAYDTHCDD